ncbi:hypothetical protein NDU88_005595 [Pleurodeles waltl]|uniref:Uncharacterized protein n=1 Tax=Pleurodeles waltl TaxID=8319 RepID=A0AAV7UIK6_PLEWA|nr:hypothetical protein NDU88_005595 [Pleurodeles waltl]
MQTQPSPLSMTVIADKLPRKVIRNPASHRAHSCQHPDTQQFTGLPPASARAPGGAYCVGCGTPASTVLRTNTGAETDALRARPRVRLNLQVRGGTAAQPSLS